MVKFSSLIQFREYIEKLPLEFIVTELFRVNGRKGKQRFGDELPFDWDLYGFIEQSNAVDGKELLGTISFRLLSADKSDGFPDVVTHGHNYLFLSNRQKDKYNNLLLYCTYYHGINDVWVIPFEIPAIYFQVQINAESAQKPLYYTPERPLVIIRDPVKFWRSTAKYQRPGHIPLLSARSKEMMGADNSPLAIRFYLKERENAGEPEDEEYFWQLQDLEVLHWENQYELYNTQIEKWVKEDNYWTNADGERRMYKNGNKPPIEFAEEGDYYKDGDGKLYKVQNGKYVLLVNHRYGNLPSDYVSSWFMSSEGFMNSIRNGLAQQFLLFGEGFPNSKFENISKFNNPSSIGLPLDFDLLEVHTSADYTEYFLLFDPLQSLTLNYPAGDFSVI